MKEKMEKLLEMIKDDSVPDEAVESYQNGITFLIREREYDRDGGRVLCSCGCGRVLSLVELHKCRHVVRPFAEVRPVFFRKEVAVDVRPGRGDLN